MKCTVSSPGKLMLFGEHAAVYGYPCIVTAVSQRMIVSLEETTDGKITIDAPQTTNTVFVQKAIAETCRVLEIEHKGLFLQTSCPFSNQFGFGSSSAVTVGTVYALSMLFGKKADQKNIFTIAYDIVRQIQKNLSGFDVAAATYGGTLYYEQFGKTIEPLSVEGASFVVGYSGAKADTVALVGDVRKKKEQEPEKVTRIFEAVSEIVTNARKEIEEKDWERVGTLMNFNQEYVRDLGVSTEKLEAMIAAAKKAGAYGAKLSGAGGGDCMIAIAPEEKRKAVGDAITAVGGQVIDVAVNAEGVRMEPNA